MDSIYKNGRKWTVFYSFSRDTYDNNEPINEIDLLLISKTKNVYYIFHSDGCDFKDCILEEGLTEVPDIETLLDDLKAKGYKELQ